jgi:hypothetical protein
MSAGAGRDAAVDWRDHAVDVADLGADLLDP